MSITREAVEERLAELRRQYEQTVANANALQGAIQDCEHWRAVLAADHSESEADPPGADEEAGE